MNKIFIYKITSWWMFYLYFLFTYVPNELDNWKIENQQAVVFICTFGSLRGVRLNDRSIQNKLDLFYKF